MNLSIIKLRPQTEEKEISCRRPHNRISLGAQVVPWGKENCSLAGGLSARTAVGEAFSGPVYLCRPSTSILRPAEDAWKWRNECVVL